VGRFAGHSPPNSMIRLRLPDAGMTGRRRLGLEIKQDGEE
jgi:hypothetical protein